MARVVCVNVIDGQENLVPTKHRNLTLAAARAKARKLNGLLRSRHIDQALKYFTVVLEDHDVPETTEPNQEGHAVVYDGIGRVHDLMSVHAHRNSAVRTMTSRTRSSTSFCVIHWASGIVTGEWITRRSQVSGPLAQSAARRKP